jgi:glutathione S-transferase
MEELGLDYDLRMMPFPPRAKARDYLDLNPLGTVPLLVDGETRMTESSAIVHYLSECYGQSRLSVAPGHPDFGAYLDFLHYADATLTFPQAVYVRFVKQEPDRGLQEAGAAYADFFRGRLKKVAQRIAGREYLCADRFTGADIAVGYGLHLARMIGLGGYLSADVDLYLDRLAGRPAFHRATAREGEVTE